MAAAPQSFRGHITEFDGLRGLAILAVTLHHFWPKLGFLHRFAHIGHFGWAGVDLFFVISGCLIGGILLDTREDTGFFKNFYMRRVLRIFPLYLIFVAFVYTIMPLLQKSASTIASESGPIWWYLFYSGNIREAITGKEPSYVLAPTWSLSIEEQFYIVFPLLVHWIPVKRLKHVLFGVMALALVLRCIALFLWPQNERIQYLFTLCRMDVLALGCLIALGLRGHVTLPKKEVTRVALPVGILLCGLFLALGWLDRTTAVCRTIGYNLVGVTCFFMVLGAIQYRGTGYTGLLRFKPLCTLGVLCYGMYLLQRPAEVVLMKVMERVAPTLNLDSTLGLLLKIATAVLAATFSWYCIEKPFLKLKRLFSSKKHPQYAESAGSG